MSISNYGREGIRFNVSGNLFIVSTCRDLQGNAPVSTLQERGDVSAFSESSRARMRRFLRETMAQYSVMVTLTYPDDYGTDGSRAKDDLRRFIQELRRNYRKTDVNWSAFWFLEFQGNGKIHFHILTTHYYDYQWVANAWFKIVGSGSEDHLKAGTRIEKIRASRNGISSYCAKYAAKFEQKNVPENFGWVGRFWGAQGYRDRLSAATFVDSKQASNEFVKKCTEWIKNLIFLKQVLDISKKLADLPNNVTVYRIGTWENAVKIRDKLRFIELYVAIDDKREPNYGDGLEEMYEEMMEDEYFQPFMDQQSCL